MEHSVDSSVEYKWSWNNVRKTQTKDQEALGIWILGDVYLGEFYCLKGQLYSLKKVVNTEKNTAQRDIQILARVDHPNIIKCHVYYTERSLLCIVLEYATKGTLEQAVMRKTSGCLEIDQASVPCT